MATSRFAHYLKVIARDKIGSFMELGDCQSFLERWIASTSAPIRIPAPRRRPAIRWRRPRSRCRKWPAAPGSYQAVAWVRPWLQFEELTASLRMVASIPQLNK